MSEQKGTQNYVSKKIIFPNCNLLYCASIPRFQDLMSQTNIIFPYCSISIALNNLNPQLTSFPSKPAQFILVPDHRKTKSPPLFLVPSPFPPSVPKVSSTFILSLPPSFLPTFPRELSPPLLFFSLLPFFFWDLFLCAQVAVVIISKRKKEQRETERRPKSFFPRHLGSLMQGRPLERAERSKNSQWVCLVLKIFYANAVGMLDRERKRERRWPVLMLTRRKRKIVIRERKKDQTWVSLHLLLSVERR